MTRWVYGIVLIALGLFLAYVGFVGGEPGGNTRPARPASPEDARQHELERLLDLMRACGKDRTTPPCDTLPEAT